MGGRVPWKAERYWRIQQPSLPQVKSDDARRLPDQLAHAAVKRDSCLVVFGICIPAGITVWRITRVRRAECGLRRRAVGTRKRRTATEIPAIASIGGPRHEGQWRVEVTRVQIDLESLRLITFPSPTKNCWRSTATISSRRHRSAGTRGSSAAASMNCGNRTPLPMTKPEKQKPHSKATWNP